MFDPQELAKTLGDLQEKLQNAQNANKDIILKCPNCNSLGPLSQGASMTTTVYYPPVWENGVYINPDSNTTTTEFTCEKCGCKFSAKFQHGECISIKEN